MVPSPIPKEIVQVDAIHALVELGFTAIGVGGGGIPVIKDDAGDLIRVEAVIDKDFASALLAESIRADLFLTSTAVEKVALNFKQAKPEMVGLYASKRNEDLSGGRAFC